MPGGNDTRRHEPLSFLPGVAERLGWYVYALRNPTNRAIFYVGKGKGDRVYQHARLAEKVGAESAAQLKLATIHEIHQAGHEVQVEIVRHLIASEPLAYEVEAAVMDTLALVGIELTNIARGHDGSRGWQPLEDIVVRYVAEPVTIFHRGALIRVSRLFRQAQTPEDLYEATRKWWVVAPARRRPDYAFSVYDGIVRAVYRIDEWEQPPEGGRRWAFRGEVDPEMEDIYLWKDVSGYLTAGAQNPIKYINC